MGKPYIKGGSIDKEELEELAKTFKTVNFRFSGDAISLGHCFEMIAERINEAENIKQQAAEKIKQYENEINADSRVKELTAKLEESYKAQRRAFKISEEEEKNIKLWKEKHDVQRHNLNTLEKKLHAGGAIGGRYYFEFYPTSIGVAANCVCGGCERLAFKESNGNYEEYKKLIKKYDAKFEFSEL